MSYAPGLRLRPILDVALPGVYAWLVTVALPLGQKEAQGWPVFFAALSLLCLGIAVGLVASRWRPWSAVAATSFVSASATVWFLIAPIEPSYGFLGMLGWASFAVGWVRATETRLGTDARAAHRIDLLPRHKMPKLSWVVLGIGLLGALSVLILAWGIEGRERSLLGQALAAVGALSLLTAASGLASALGRQAAAKTFSRTQFGRSLILISLVAVGCWLTYIRWPNAN